MNYETLITNQPHLFNNENALIEIITDKAVISEWTQNQDEKLRTKNKFISKTEIGIVFEDDYIIVLRDLVKFQSKQLGGYCRIINQADIRGGKGIVVLPIYNGKIVVLHQYRHPTRSWHWELPRGFGEPNTPAIENVKLELNEEIEGITNYIVELGSYHPNTGIEGNIVELFFAELSSIGNPNPDEGIQEYKLIKISEFERMIKDAEITDGFSIAAFTRAKLRELI